MQSPVVEQGGQSSVTGLGRQMCRVDQRCWQVGVIGAEPPLHRDHCLLRFINVGKQSSVDLNGGRIGGHRLEGLYANPEGHWRIGDYRRRRQRYQRQHNAGQHTNDETETLIRTQYNVKKNPPRRGG